MSRQTVIDGQKRKKEITFVNIGFPWCVTIVHCSQSNVTDVLWNDSLLCFMWKYNSVTPPSNILRKYRGINVLPIAVKIGREKTFIYCRSTDHWRVHLLYLLGPSSKQNVNVNVASSSKNSVANESHQQLSLSCFNFC